MYALGVGDRHAGRPAPDHDPEFALPVDLGPAGRNPNRLAVGDDGGRRLQEEVRVPARVIGGTLPDARRTLRAGRRGSGRRRRSRGRAARGAVHLGVMLTIVHRHIQHRHRIHDRWQRLEILAIVDVGRSRSRRGRFDRADDLADPRPDPGVVPGDEILHVGRRGDGGGRRSNRGIRRGKIDDHRVAQHDADERAALPLERAELERCGGLSGRERTRRKRRRRRAKNETSHGWSPPADSKRSCRADSVIADGGS